MRLLKNCHIKYKGISPLLATVLKPLFFRKEKSLGFKRKYYTKGISPLLATVLKLLSFRKKVACSQRKYYTKGISPLLATVLLIAATVVTTTMLSGWVSTTMGTTQTTISNRTSEGVACAAAEIIIDDVYSGAGSNSSAYAIVRNSGNTDNIALISAQLYDRLGNNFTTTNSLPTNLNKGQMATLSFKYPVLSNTTNDTAHGINNGTLTGGPIWASGRFGTALSFDGTNDYVDAGNASNLDIRNNITVEAWVKWSIIGDNTGVLEKIAPASAGYMLYVTATTADFYAYGLTDTSVQGAVIQPNQWYYVAGTYNGTHLSIYLDGIRAGSDPSTGSIAGTTNNVRIGRYDSGFFNGVVDDVAIWNRSLTNAEINTSMNQGPLTVSNTNDLVGYWAFDEGKGVLSCPGDFSRVVVATSCGGVSAEFSKRPKC